MKDFKKNEIFSFIANRFCGVEDIYIPPIKGPKKTCGLVLETPCGILIDQLYM